MKRFFWIIIKWIGITAVILSLLWAAIGCSGPDYNPPVDQRKFLIRNIELYKLNDMECVANESSGMNILFHCDTEHVDEDTTVEAGSFVLADVWVTDERLNAKYINVEIRDSEDQLDYGLYNYLIVFNGTRQEIGSEYQIFMILSISNTPSSYYTVDVWLEDYNKKLTDVYTVEIHVDS